MTNSKTTKRALLSSAFAVLMCFAMLIGTTFAWFTDEAQASVSRIQSGTLDVDIVDKEGNSLEGRTLSFKNADGSDNILWEPGCRYSLEQFKVVNKGNLALKYSIQITGISGSAKLNEVIDWTFEGLAGGTGELLPQAASELITITGVMDENADNDYQNLTIDGIAITVFATQLSSEKDSIDETYDAAAPLTSYWDGESSVMPEEADGVYTVKTAAEFVGIMNYSQNINSSFLGKTIVLENNIDFGGRAVKGVGSHQGNFAGTFDGKGHTVSNFKIDNNREWYAGLFNQVSHGGNIKDLKVENATVIGGRMTGVIASNLDSGAIDNCHVKNCTVVATVKKAGSITGYTSYGTVTNCTAENVNVYCADTDVNESGEIIGYENTGSVASGNTATNVAVVRGATVVSTAAEFAVLNTKQGMSSIAIIDDIDMSAYSTRKGLLGGTFGQTFASSGVTIYGNGHTISGLTAAIVDATTYDITIKDLTVKDSSIKDYVSGEYTFVSAFVAYSDANNVTLENCKIVNSVIGDGNAEFAGAFIGAFYGNKLTVNGCEVGSDTTVKGNKNLGGVIGFCQTSGQAQMIENCKVAANKTDTFYVGAIAGTVNNANTLEIKDCTFSGEACGRIVDATVNIR